jgi:hypothetical protein
MDHTMFMLGEIGDKMPSAPLTLLTSIILVAIVLLLARLRWWLALFAMPIFGFWSWMLYAELREPIFGQQILAELGKGYVLSQFVCINLPALIGAVLVLRYRSTQIRRRRIANGLCAKCAYPRIGTQSCPECGSIPSL